MLLRATRAERHRADGFRSRVLERPGSGAKTLQRRSVLEKKIERQERFESQIADAGVLFEF